MEKMAEQMQRSIGLTGLLSIVVAMLCITLSWWALQQFRFDLFVKQPKSLGARMLHLLLAIVIGYQLSRFLMDYFQWSLSFTGMF